MCGHLLRAAECYGTPVYVVDALSLEAAAARLEAAFPDPWIRQYSLKANDLPALVATLAARGWGANVVSSGEWRQAAEAGLPRQAVTFEGIGKSDAELAWAVRGAVEGDPVRWVALESAAEAWALAALAEQAGLGHGGLPGLDILLRLNPQVSPETLPGLAVGAGSSKFGMDEAEILGLVRSGLDRPGLRVRGIHVHVGSDLGDVSAWADAGVRAVRLLGEISAHVERPDTVDFGGGFPLELDGGRAPAEFHDALCGGSPTRGSSFRADGPSSRGATWSGRPAGWWPGCCTPGRGRRTPSRWCSTPA